MNNKERLVGIHHRVDGDLTAALKQAMEIGANCMQIFVSSCITGKLFSFSRYDLGEYLRIMQTSGVAEVYAHASFRISLTTPRKDILGISKRIILEELKVCEEIGAKYLVIHPGSSKDHSKTSNDPHGIGAGIETLALTLNQLCLKNTFSTKMLIENTAYGKSNVGSNLQDFVALQNLLEFPEKIGFCLDLAHCYAYGYPLDPVDDFVNLLNSTMELKNIDLVHLNDSATKLGSRIDQHKTPGEGYIGIKPLREFVKHKETIYIPTIMELPPATVQDAKRSVQLVKSWF